MKGCPAVMAGNFMIGQRAKIMTREDAIAAFVVMCSAFSVLYVLFLIALHAASAV